MSEKGKKNIWQEFANIRSERNMGGKTTKK